MTRYNVAYCVLVSISALMLGRCAAVAPTVAQCTTGHTPVVVCGTDGECDLYCE